MAVLDCFLQLADAPDQKMRVAIVLDHPALLLEAHWSEISLEIDKESFETQERCRECLSWLERVAEQLERNPEQWPKNAGPIQDLASRVIEGEWSELHALSVATTSALTDEMTPLYVRAVTWQTSRLALQGNWPNAVVTHRLLLKSLDALVAGPAVLPMQREALTGWLEVVALACHKVPDGRLFSDAVARAQSYLEVEEVTTLAAEVMRNLGIMHLDPWISGRTSSNLKNELRIWRQNFVDRYGEIAARDPATKMPEPIDALRHSISWSHRAVADLSGVSRGRALKALAVATIWLELFGGEADQAGARRYATEALNLLPPGRGDTDIQELQRLLQMTEPAKRDNLASSTAEVSAGHDLLWRDPSEVMRTHGDAVGRERYLWLARTLSKKQPHAAISLVLRLWPELAGDGAEAKVREAAEILFGALTSISKVDEILEGAGTDPERLRPMLSNIAAREYWSESRQIAAMAGIACALSSSNREEEGLNIIQSALDTAPTHAEGLVPPLRVLQADLYFGTAVNAYEAGQWDTAVERYIISVTNYMRLGLSSMAMEALRRAENVLVKNATLSPQTFAIGLAGCAAELVAIGPQRIGDVLHDIWQRVLLRIYAQPPTNTRLLWLLLQAAKGAGFAAMLQHADYDWREDASATTLLARIGQLRGNRHSISATIDPSDADLTLVSHDLTGEQNAEQDDPLSNLERRFDGYVSRRLTDGRDAHRGLLLGEPLQAAIGSRTVLMSNFASRTEDGRQAMTTVLQDNQGVSTAVTAMPDASRNTAIRVGGHRAEMTLWGFEVAALRAAVTEDPGPADVVQKGAALLSRGHRQFLPGHLPSKLAELSEAGRDHLCIHPHGPYHFYPMHLLGRDGETLADRWIVTTIPHPSILQSKAEARQDLRKLPPVVAFGIDFRDRLPHGLAPLAGASAEARAVATVLNGECWTNEGATETRFLEAIAGATRVHVATHGAHDVSAPLFQRLFLHPDPASDGVFHAYEAIGLDLRHLDLITLSACETALGRCDTNDTLRGLPSALFVSGAQTIISTLWPVEDQAARLFFETLYGAIGKGAGKLDAFRVAQVEVRRSWPAYRDWGAFHYAGRW